MTYGSYDFWWWPFVFILIAGILPNGVWRWAGALLVGGMDEDSEWLIFVRCVATALVAAVVTQFVFFPNGALAEIPVWVRGGSAGIGFLLFLWFGQRMIVGVLSAELLLVLGAWFAKY